MMQKITSVLVLLFLLSACGSDDNKKISAPEVDAYCTTMSNETSSWSVPTTISQSGDRLTIKFDFSSETGSTEGYEYSGLLKAGVVHASGTDPDGNPVTVDILFDVNNDGFSGTLQIGNQINNLLATAGECHNYQNPAGTPECILPFVETSAVMGGQQYNAIANDLRHSGLDFRFADGVQEIIAPCTGVVTALHRVVTSKGDIVFEIQLRINDQWRYFIGFEPNSDDPYINDAQAELLAASLSQIVKPGDFLGYLLIPNTPYPVIHWQIEEIKIDGTRSDVNLCKYLNTQEQERLEIAFKPLGLSPACYDEPTIYAP